MRQRACLLLALAVARKDAVALTRIAAELAVVRFWVALLLCFDVVFVTLALWTFEPLMTD